MMKQPTLIAWISTKTKASLYALAAQAWSGVGGLVTASLIASFASAEEQGVYYTFTSLLALQALVELGFSSVLVQFASHEMAKLTLLSRGAIAGDRWAKSRLVSLFRLAAKWYAWGALGVVALLSAVGLPLLASGRAGVPWLAPWITLSIATGIVILTTPVLAIVEGCNEVEFVYGTRLVAGVLGSAGSWLLIVHRHALYALAFATLLRAGVLIGKTLWSYRGLFRELLESQVTERIDWRGQLWPLQWRVALNYSVGYLIVGLFTPVVYYFSGAATAGRLGMSLALIGGVTSLANAIFGPRLPRLGILAASGQTRAHRRVALRAGSTAIAVVAVGLLALVGGAAILPYIAVSYAERILSPGALLIFSFGYLLHTFFVILVMYLRSFKREPLVWVAVVAGTTSAVLVPLAGFLWGVVGVGAAFCVVAAAWTVPASLRVFGRVLSEVEREQAGLEEQLAVPLTQS